MNFNKTDKIIDFIILNILRYGEYVSVNPGDIRPQFDVENSYELSTILKIAEKEGLIEKKNRTYSTLTPKGYKIQKDGGYIKHLEFLEHLKQKQVINESENQEKTKLEIDNLKLQNESLEYKKLIIEREEQILNLTKDNLRLTNWDIRFRWYIATISFIIGLIIKYLIS